MSDVTAELQDALESPTPAPVSEEPTPLPAPVVDPEHTIEEPVSAPSPSSEDAWTDEHGAAEEAALAAAIQKRSAAKVTDGEDEDDIEMPLPEKKKGFWGRLFKRKNKFESVEDWEEHDGESYEEEPALEEPAPAAEPVPAPTMESAPEPPVVEAPDPEPVVASVTETPETRLAEVELPPSLGSEALSPVVITRQIQVPISLNAEEIRRGAKLRLVLEIQIIPSEGTGTDEGSKVA